MKWGTTWKKWQRCLGLSRVLNSALVFRIDSLQAGIEASLWLASERLPAFETVNRDQQHLFRMLLLESSILFMI